MKKRNIMFIVSIILIVALCFAATSAFAVSKKCSDSYTSTKATASMTVTRCCVGATLETKLIARGTQRLVLNPSSATGYVLSSPVTGDRTSLSASVNVTNTNYAMIGSSHYCYVRCRNCNDDDGGFYH